MEFTVASLLPPNDVDLEYEDLHAVMSAQEECQVMQDGSEVNVIDDEELGSTVVELVGPQAALVFQCGAILRYLVLHIKNLDRFLSIEVEVVDDSKQYRTFHLSNRRSLASIHGSRCELPLSIGPGWQHLNMDLEAFTSRCGRSVPRCAAMKPRCARAQGVRDR